MGKTVGNCFTCGKKVLGLTGQDVHLDPDVLRWRGAPAVVLSEILADGAYGNCHVVCFRQLDPDRRGFWREWTLRGHSSAVKVNESTYVSVPPPRMNKKLRLADDVIVITTECVVYPLRREQINAAVEVTGGHLLPVQGELHLDLEAIGDSAQKEGIRRLAREPAASSLEALLGLLDIKDRLARPEAVEKGTAHPLGVDHGKARFRAEYRVFAAEGLVEWCRARGRPRSK
jgi:hypothetical protein